MGRVCYHNANAQGDAAAVFNIKPGSVLILPSLSPQLWVHNKLEEVFH